MTRIFSRRKRPVLEAMGQIFIFLSVVGAVLYGGGWYPEGLLWQLLTKASAVTFLALFVAVNIRTFGHALLFLALLASVSGDVLIAMPHEQAFMRGLLGFMVAHVIFIVLYVTNRRPMKEIGTVPIRLASLLWVFAFVSGFALNDMLGDMRMYVFTYTAVLTAMATAALLSKFPLRLTGIGAVLFIASDAALGARQFIPSVPEYMGYFVWVTYYASELMMTMGVMLTDDRPTNFGGYRFD
ncbi:MAG: lysoplasmalogenase [Alphaproteobacteria bacterium]|nr:lysoplasmalogenase [Alphaproteobacteria bacterium]